MSFSEITLLAVTGVSPAVLTETVWALAHGAGVEAVVPDRVICVTTTLGREQLRRVFEPVAEWGGISPWDALRDALEGEGYDVRGRLRFGSTGDDIRVITAVDGGGRSRELEDIRDLETNAAAADFLLEQVRGVVENPDRRLIASVAGGRKTMSALLYACMSLLGREWDRVTHVLVSEPYETLGGFWFPKQPGGGLMGRDGRVYEPREAQVWLAEVPFVPLRNLFEERLTRRPGSFRGLVAEASRQVGVEGVLRGKGSLPVVELDVRKRELAFAGRRIELTGPECVLALVLLQAAKEGRGAFSRQTVVADACEAAGEELRRRADAEDFSDWRGEAPVNFDADGVRKVVFRLRQRLKRAGVAGLQLDRALRTRKGVCWEIPGRLVRVRG